MENWHKRIQELDPSEIKSTDIPKYVTAVSQFIDMTTEAQARFLTLNELLCLYEDEIDSKAIREHDICQKKKIRRIMRKVDHQIKRILVRW